MNISCSGFQDHTLIGQQDVEVQQDIQLSGLGIMPEHCVVDIENGDVWLTPIEGARSVFPQNIRNEMLGVHLYYNDILMKKLEANLDFKRMVCL